MGAERRIATIVALGLVVIATIVLVYVFNEKNRRDTEASSQVDVSVERAASIFAANCVVCHGPDGLAGPEYLGIPLNTPQNTTLDPVLGQEREDVIQLTIERGRNAMPAWLDSEGGVLNQEQVNDLVLLIREGAWNQVVAADEEHNLEAHGVAATSTPPELPTPASPEEAGKDLFGLRCAGCHISNDFPDGGTVGPDLTGLASMDCTPVFCEPVERDYLEAWETNPQATNPAATMPNLNLSPGDVTLVVDYLLTLE